MRAIALLLAATAAFGQNAAALREDVTYLASSKLDGRATPSRGLNLAARFIARKFQGAGLEPGGLGGYFQGADLKNGPWNVVGILRGSDPGLRDQYVILSAHYDHLGHSFPGADDNASGASSVAEIAAALAARTDRPKRSVVFIAFYGEEEGLLGSGYYVQHPVVPLKDTIAEINLEQMGRTDDDSGQRVAEFAMTGTSYSNLPELIARAVNGDGVQVYHRPDEDQYFDRSDNYSFAAPGVVDTTIGVAFDFPDYHKKTDTADKLDYDNMAVVDRAIAAAVWALANSAQRPVWKHNPLLP